jgi:type IV pilus assembly protein PilP
MMNRLLLSIFMVIFLGACTGSDELHDYVTQVKSRPALPIEPLPVIKNFEAMKFSSADRTPFTEPQPELAMPTQVAKKDCLQPDVGRVKEPLEQYSLDNLSMRGTMGINGHLWALISSQEGEVYRVAQGQYMGLNHGLITMIKPDAVELQEFVPDGKGCWTKRTTKLNILVAE